MAPAVWSRLSSYLLVLSLASSTLAQATAAAPGQPTRTNAPIGGFEEIGDSIASAQQLFLGTVDKVYVVDKVEGNPTQINGHPAWAAEFALSTGKGRPMDVITNSFCAGGNVLGNGTWLNVGGNQAVTYGGLAAPSQTGGGAYDDPDGGRSMRLLDPTDDGKCDWRLSADLSTRRWYPTVETLEDGRAIILGGCANGGFVNDAGQTNPTYEFFPPAAGAKPINSPLLQNTLPANLFPLTWLLPSGLVFLQANWGTSLLDYKNQKEFALPDMPHAVRTYPASAGTAMLPLTPANNWTATILFCGGSNIASDRWKTDWNIAQYTASTSCVSITPDVSGNYKEEDDILEPRAMGNFINLPNGQLLYVNGAGTGVAGYGNDTWAIGQSYADNPVFTPAIYDPSAPAGKRWTRDGISASPIPRMYHSTAILLADGAVLISGSNPNADYNVGPNVKYPTEYRTEKFYPSYYNERRPEPQGLVTQLSYGGSYFNVTLTKDDLFGDSTNVQGAQVVLVRPGFSTHTMNMGQRMIQLENSYTTNADGSAVLHVSQMPPNPAIFPPGPTLMFVVVKGVPSVGVMVMVGSGQIETQKILTVSPLPASGGAATNTTSSDGSGTDKNHNVQASSAFGLSSTSDLALLPLLGVAVWTFLSMVTL
ncbi:hypothetical protein NLI96_g4231 [Meripilus lineatus]|uniref:Glyoxal oxidase n=1 Tax=Meripilus lineatus TaxID=2056292 RepID=A0AAD5YEZ3_9APHY|nr:hypothetical protein NLI96_g4231 [Physisporinus lineatus]